MSFWNALSVLAPVAPAMSDAKDLRTQREQEQQQFAQDQALRQAQLTAQKLAAQGEQQRQTQAAQPVILGAPQWDPATHSSRVLTFDPNTGALALKDAPGVDPSAAAEARYQADRWARLDSRGRPISFLSVLRAKAADSKIHPINRRRRKAVQRPRWAVLRQREGAGWGCRGRPFGGQL